MDIYGWMDMDIRSSYPLYMKSSYKRGEQQGFVLGHTQSFQSEVSGNGFRADCGGYERPHPEVRWKIKLPRRIARQRVWTGSESWWRIRMKLHGKIRGYMRRLSAEVTPPIPPLGEGKGALQATRAKTSKSHVSGTARPTATIESSLES